MGFPADLSPETRILDIGVPDATLALAFARLGLKRYIGLTEPSRVDEARRGAGDFSTRIHAFDEYFTPSRCAADLLVVRRGYTHLAWDWSALQRFRWVAFEDRSSAERVEASVALALHRLRGRLRDVGTWSDSGTRFTVFETDHYRHLSPRKYFSPEWGVSGFADRLREAGIDYAVLRWFETLPAIEPGEDLDILVRDVDVSKLLALVESEPGTIPIDVYSVTGVEGTDYNDAAYYVPELATRILDGAVMHSSGMRVPSPSDYLHSLAYHALYHKGAASGLDTALSTHQSNPEHDYRAALDAAASTAGVSMPSELESIDEYLGSVGWRPPADALRRLSIGNSWLARRLGTDSEVAAPDHPEFALFLIRKRTLRTLTVDEVVSALAGIGFDILLVNPLDKPARKRGKLGLRGGNWGKGPFPKSGGGPAVVVAAVHYAPTEVPQALRTRYPHLTSEEVFLAKQAAREVLESRLSPNELFNAVHSADNEHEAWEYLSLLAPEKVEAVRRELAARVKAQDAQQDVIATLSRGRRARVDVVQTADGRVVRKTFADVGARHFRREVEALDELSQRIPAVPRILDRGDRWFTLAYHEDQLAPHRSGSLVSLRILRRMVDTLREIHELGWDLIDAKPANFVLDPREGLRVVDLEFAYRRPESRTDEFSESTAFVSPSAALYQDLPVGDSSYETRWLPAAGMPLKALVAGGPWEQRAHRLVYRLRRETVAQEALPRRMARSGRDVARALRRRARERYLTWAEARAWTGGAR